MNHCQRLTIFEGPDGGGKTTLAKAYAEATGAQYKHLGPFPEVTAGLARLYIEAMFPALLGQAPVVMDRSWLSEYPYGVAFRGRVRLNVEEIGLLNRLAAMCSPIVVMCLPRWETVKTNYLERKGQEYLNNIEQLRSVYRIYETMSPGLPFVTYDYQAMGVTGFAIDERNRNPPMFSELQRIFSSMKGLL